MARRGVAGDGEQERSLQFIGPARGAGPTLLREETVRESETTPASVPPMPWTRRAGRLLVIYVALVVVFVLAMTAVYSLPQRRIVKNLKRSEQLLVDEGLYPRVMIQHRAYQLDNFTDSIMLGTAIEAKPGGPLLNAMGGFRQYAKNAQGKGSPIEGLQQSVRGQRDHLVAYARYWHGYQVVLRPALVFLTLADIRYVNMMILSALTLTVLLMLARRAGSRAAAAFGLAAAACGFLVVPMSIQFSNLTYVMLWALLVMLAKSESDWLIRNTIEFFFVVGMFTAFFDLYTTPTMTLGMPLAVALVLAARPPREHPWKLSLVLAGQACVAWSVGYVMSWGAKWFVATAVTGIDVVGDAVGKTMFWTVAKESKPLYLEAVKLNLGNLVPMLRPQVAIPTALFLGLLVLVAGVLLLTSRSPSARARQVLPVLLVVPLPYLWYLATSHPATVHNWFNYRAQIYAVFAVIYVVSSAIDFETLGRRFGFMASAPIVDEG